MTDGDEPTLAPILVVDDDEDTREFILLLLGMACYHTLEANSGGAALAVVAAQPVRAIVLDLRLPDMDGFAVCRHLRANGHPDLPILLVTADGRPELERRTRDAGVTSVLRKPFPPEMLTERLRSLLAMSA
jgi:CheY-like chemotaxis protein